MSIEDDFDDENTPLLDEDIIPGDNDKQEPAQDAVPPYNPDAPENLTRLPDIGGEIPIEKPVVG